MTIKEIEERIKSTFSTEYVSVESQDNIHFYAIIVSSDFEVINKMKQHQLIMDLFKEEIAQEIIHALSLKTYTPTKWQNISH